MATGNFDPWSAVNALVEAEADAAEKSANTHVEPIDAATASEEDRRRYQQVLDERRRVSEAAADLARQRLESPREAQFALDLTRMFEEAAWIAEGVGFPDGRPLNQQHPVKARIWYMFVIAIRAVQSGGAKAKKDDPDGRPPDDSAPGH